MHVTDLWIHPVKSLGGQAIDSARVEPWGLEGDRRWGLVDPSGEKVTARDLHALLRLHAEQVDDETIRIHDGGESILVDIPLGLPPIPVSHARQGFAPPADQDVSEWISERVGAPFASCGRRSRPSDGCPVRTVAWMETRCPSPTRAPCSSRRRPRWPSCRNGSTLALQRTTRAQVRPCR